jgi:Na+-translocating ferredoxin:NAD+ oxidoreductase subunit G
MKNTLVVGGKLALICGVAAIILGLVNAVTAPTILLNKQKELGTAVSKVAGDMKVGEQVMVDESGIVDYYYPADGKAGEETFIMKLTGTGYGGDMGILAGYSGDGEIFSVVLMENQETPGIGKKAENPEYMDKFIGTGGVKPVPVLKDQLTQEQADAVSGATITYLGVSQALAAGSDFVRGLGEEK